jgi:hypothetical protein
MGINYVKKKSELLCLPLSTTLSLVICKEHGLMREKQGKKESICPRTTKPHVFKHF